MVPDEKVLINEWRSLYKESWKGVICDEAFAHPAKFSRALIHHIYEHVIAEGWATAGDSVVDPFGGVALGAFPAMQHGLNWYGCELEAKFVGLGSQNVALWNERFSRMPNWGSARLVQGDSRQLVDVLRDAHCCVSSPPYVLARQDTTKVPPTLGHIYGADEQERIAQLSDHRYGETEGQLGTMREGDLSLVISSPPYTNETVNDRNGIDLDKVKKPGGVNSQSRKMSGYGEASGQLGNLAVTSPPYNPPMSQDHNGTRGGSRGTTPSEKGAFVKYGNSEGQLEGLSMDGHGLAISSPPFSHPETRDRLTVTGDKAVADFMNRAYTVDRQGQDAANLAVSSPPFESVEGSQAGRKHKDPAAVAKQRATDYQSGRLKGNGASEAAILAQLERENEYNYGETPGNIGNQQGETFWSASRLILEQLHQVIVPGGHAVFVVKAFVRDKKIVDFPGQWAQLCEAVGFRLLHDHHAMLTEKGARQPAMDEFDICGNTWRIVTRDKDHSVARKSFFRRLAESKGSPRIDYENVQCFVRP